MKIKTLQSQLDAMNEILKQIKCDKEQASAQQSLALLKQQMLGSIDRIKVFRCLVRKFSIHMVLV